VKRGCTIDVADHIVRNSDTVEIVYNETGYNEQPDITSKFGAVVWSRIHIHTTKYRL